MSSGTEKHLVTTAELRTNLATYLDALRRGATVTVVDRRKRPALTIAGAAHQVESAQGRQSTAA